MNRLIEIRSYRLKPGAAARFQTIVAERAMPLLRAAGMDVVCWGASPHEDDCYFLVRSFADLADLQQQQDSFYGSDIWRSGPREDLLACIDTFLNTLLWLGPEALQDMRRNNPAPA